jgi:hypothetical protein
VVNRNVNKTLWNGNSCLLLFRLLRTLAIRRNIVTKFVGLKRGPVEFARVLISWGQSFDGVCINISGVVCIKAAAVFTLQHTNVLISLSMDTEYSSQTLQKNRSELCPVNLEAKERTQSDNNSYRWTRSAENRILRLTTVERVYLAEKYRVYILILQL